MIVPVKCSSHSYSYLEKCLLRARQILHTKSDFCLELCINHYFSKYQYSMRCPKSFLIEKHRLWVSTSGQQGLQLDVSDVDMRELETLKMQKLTALRGKNVKFFGMNLYKVELQSTQLEKADFRRCDKGSAWTSHSTCCW